VARTVHRSGSVKKAMLRWVGAAGSVAMWGVAVACGSSSVDLTSPDGSIDGAGTDSSGGDGSAFEAMAPPPDAAAEDSAEVAAEASAPVTCAPPADGTKAALCIIVSPEAIAFVAADPSFDGKGLLAVDVHDTANPDGPDGGSIPALQGMTFPSGDAGGAEIDLSSPLPQVRFDGLPPGVVYPRVVFVDSRNTDKVGAGWWLGGYDLAGGLKKPTLLSSVTLAPGVGTTITIELTALRALGVTLTRSVTPIGNAQGSAVVVVTPDPTPNDASALFGAATAPCANLAAADASAAANGFVFGAGPYYAVGVLDDFEADASISLPPGALTSLAMIDGSLASPPSTRLEYAPRAYVIQKTIDLDLSVPMPDAGTDPVTCP
jgi:hypothetical protein